MPIFRLSDALVFPPVELAEDGLLAVGGDLSAPRLLLAYSQGIFPWYDEGDPILWHSPETRTVLTLDSLHVSHRLERTLRSSRFTLSLDTAFEAVISACADTPRPDQDGTWITSEMHAAYIRLHELGYAHSVETWHEGQLVGGLYGVSLGACFFGESMFSWQADASKAALVTLVRWGAQQGIELCDCQMETEHLLRMGAFNISRAEYLRRLEAALASPTRRGTWQLQQLPA